MDERSRNDLQEINQRNWELFRSALHEFEARIDARFAAMDALTAAPGSSDSAA